jgi:hypothetical protein
MNDPLLFRRARIEAVVWQEVRRSPRDPCAAARRALARLSDDRAMMGPVTLAALEAAARLEARAQAQMQDEDDMWRAPSPDGVA